MLNSRGRVAREMQGVACDERDSKAGELPPMENETELASYTHSLEPGVIPAFYSSATASELVGRILDLLA